MRNFSTTDVVLVRYPFSNLQGDKIRPAVVVGTPSTSLDLFLVALTSNLESMLEGEFALTDWQAANLNRPTAVKRTLWSMERALIIKRVGSLSSPDYNQLKRSLRLWLGL